MTSRIASADATYARTLYVPARANARDGRPKIPAPMIELITSATRSQRRRPRTNCAPDPGSTSTRPLSSQIATGCKNRCALSANEGDDDDAYQHEHDTAEKVLNGTLIASFVVISNVQRSVQSDQLEDDPHADDAGRNNALPRPLGRMLKIPPTREIQREAQEDAYRSDET